MKRAAVVAAVVLCLFLSGCSAMLDGEYVWTQSHRIPVSPGNNQNISASTYQQLCGALTDLAEAGTEQATISVGRYDRGRLESDAARAVRSVCQQNPIAAYAVEKITYELGTSGGEAALAVKIRYLHDKTEIRKIRNVADNAEAEEAIAQALKACDAGIVLKIAAYEQTDFVQMVERYGLNHPEYVMESPQTTENVYPATGTTRVVELKFTYQASRDSLRHMQAQVEPVFASAKLYVSGDGLDSEKYSQLFSFLMERYDYTLETSMTPAYSLLRHGVGDSKAFAAVYAAMCRQAGLECFLVSGTREGTPWWWNIVRFDGAYYHVDLLRCDEDGRFRVSTDEEMAGYVWDYSAFPPCGTAVEGGEEESGEISEKGD